MSTTYKATANDSFEFEFSEKEIHTLDAQQISSGSFHILEDHRSYKAEILAADFLWKKYRVSINSNTYEIAISNELDQLIEEMGLSLGTAQQINDINAPMPGLILSINVKKGDEVKENEHLLVLEAMKMENTLSAPRDGVVKLVSVKVGETVGKNQLLIEME